MLTIKGKCVRRERVKIPAPDDGVHRNGSDGFIKGAHCAYLDNDDSKPMFHGQVGVYWRVSKDRGLKVFYSIKHGWAANKKWAMGTRRRMHVLAKRGVCLEPGKIIKVEVDLNYKDRVIKNKVVYALEVPHIHYPECMIAYAHGYPYDFSSYDHPDHTPAGYLRAKKRIDREVKKAKMKDVRFIGDSYKIGDMLWCCKRNKWFLCDIG